jgi:hypothetical protein
LATGVVRSVPASDRAAVAIGNGLTNEAGSLGGRGNAAKVHALGNHPVCQILTGVSNVPAAIQLRLLPGSTGYPMLQVLVGKMSLVPDINFCQ